MAQRHTRDVSFLMEVALTVSGGGFVATLLPVSGSTTFKAARFGSFTCPRWLMFDSDVWH